MVIGIDDLKTLHILHPDFPKRVVITVGSHILPGLKYSRAFSLSNTTVPVVQFIGLEYSVLEG